MDHHDLYSGIRRISTCHGKTCRQIRAQIRISYLHNPLRMRFPQEKRGMALGLVGGVYGIANVFGASAGSAVLDIFGICSLTVMILSLLYAIKEIDFFNMRTSLMSVGVYPFLIIFLVFIPIFIYAEKRADDPVISLRYFTDRNVPQFSENCLKLSTGSGGYLVIILGLFAGLGAPVSGKLIDRYGAKLIAGQLHDACQYRQQTVQFRTGDIISGQVIGYCHSTRDNGRFYCKCRDECSG